ncbi:MAG TPA: hypothetical protein ENH94_01720 [Phycisphaerales bacterium]|nr:hypothetical protein [Phycisphaerales bacterium]
MNLLDHLEKRYRRFAVPHMTRYIVLGQVAAYIFIAMEQIDPAQMAFVPKLVLEGQIWRLITFVLVPPFRTPISIFFGLYLFYLVGSALENHWGAFRYNVYLLIAYVSTVIFAFFTPGYAATNVFIGGSFFLAFAFLYPDFQLYLMFILPVRMKWLAMLAWIIYFLVIVFGNWSGRFMALASILNFLVFFGADVVRKAKYGRRKMTQQATRYATKDKPRHCCVVCGITEKSQDKPEFRYCNICQPTACYCTEHLEGHEHICG